MTQKRSLHRMEGFLRPSPSIVVGSCSYRPYARPLSVTPAGRLRLVSWIATGFALIAGGELKNSSKLDGSGAA